MSWNNGGRRTGTGVLVAVFKVLGREVIVEVVKKEFGCPT